MASETGLGSNPEVIFAARGRGANTSSAACNWMFRRTRSLYPARAAAFRRLLTAPRCCARLLFGWHLDSGLTLNLDFRGFQRVELACSLFRFGRQHISQNAELKYFFVVIEGLRRNSGSHSAFSLQHSAAAFLQTFLPSFVPLRFKDFLSVIQTCFGADCCC